MHRRSLLKALAVGIGGVVVGAGGERVLGAQPAIGGFFRSPRGELSGAAVRCRQVEMRALPRLPDGPAPVDR